MNSSREVDQSCQQPINLEEYTIEKEVNYNDWKNRNQKLKIHIQFISDQKIIYSYNGSILRVVEGHDVREKHEMFNNLDQIHNLSWQCQFIGNQKKYVKQIAIWNKQLLENVCGYYKEAQKYGLWKDLFLNYSNQAKVFEIGEYYKGLKIGKWNYINKEWKIGGGLYNKDGQKKGKWIELDEGFNKKKKVVYYGEYDKKSMKLGKWDIMYCKYGEERYKQIGGGSYDQQGNQIKIGKWVELDEGFYYEKQFTYQGEYNINGMKVGRWDIMYCNNDEQENDYMQLQYMDKGEYNYLFSGGGLYDQEGNQNKIGEWVEIDREFEDKKVTYNGQYNMNGMKIGQWDIMKYNGLEEELTQITFK